MSNAVFDLEALAVARQMLGQAALEQHPVIRVNAISPGLQVIVPERFQRTADHARGGIVQYQPPGSDIPFPGAGPGAGQDVDQPVPVAGDFLFLLAQRGDIPLDGDIVRHLPAGIA